MEPPDFSDVDCCDNCDWSVEDEDGRIKCDRYMDADIKRFTWCADYNYGSGN